MCHEGAHISYIEQKARIRRMRKEKTSWNGIETTKQKDSVSFGAWKHELFESEHFLVGQTDLRCLSLSLSLSITGASLFLSLYRLFLVHFVLKTHHLMKKYTKLHCLRVGSHVFKVPQLHKKTSTFVILGTCITNNPVLKHYE
jgi:hypothetical protein